MTRPRMSPDRQLYGVLGKHPDGSKLLSQWNAYFAKHDIDGFMDRYPATAESLHERLSEMFHFDRRAYIVAPDLQEAVVSLLDTCDELRVNLIVNRNGIFSGYWVDDHLALDTVLATIEA